MISSDGTTSSRILPSWSVEHLKWCFETVPEYWWMYFELSRTVHMRSWKRRIVCLATSWAFMGKYSMPLALVGSSDLAVMTAVAWFGTFLTDLFVLFEQLVQLCESNINILLFELWIVCCNCEVQDRNLQWNNIEVLDQIFKLLVNEHGRQGRCIYTASSASFLHYWGCVQVIVGLITL